MSPMQVRVASAASALVLGIGTMPPRLSSTEGAAQLLLPRLPRRCWVSGASRVVTKGRRAKAHSTAMLT